MGREGVPAPQWKRMGVKKPIERKENNKEERKTDEKKIWKERQRIFSVVGMLSVCVCGGGTLF